MADEKQDEYKVPDEEHKEADKAEAGIFELIKSAWFTAQASFFGGKSGANTSMTEAAPVKPAATNKKTGSIAVITHLFKKDQARKTHETLADENAEAKEAEVNKPESKKSF